MMLQRDKVTLLLTTLVFICVAPVPTHSVTIAERGLSNAVIVVAQDAPEPEQHAAAELAEFLKKVTDASFEIVHQASARQSRLLVGPAAARLAVPDFSTEGLGTEGIVIRTIGNNLILAGGYPRGTLYAVYTFLEDEVGCRWWSSKDSTIPKITTLEIGSLNVRYVPLFELRMVQWLDAFDADWAVRNKSNGNDTLLDTKRGGKIRYAGLVHTFYQLDPLMPVEKYFKDHPEWYSEIKGERTWKYGQLCLTNEEMREELVKNLKERLRENPDANSASVSQNDWLGNCQCSRCAAVEKEEDSPAGLMLRFVNAVAVDIEKEFPNVAIDTLAYQYTRKPPKYTKPRHNVIVRLCPIECTWATPLSDENNEINKRFCDDLIGWSKICNRIYIWDYVTNQRHFFRPHPNLRVLGPNIKLFAKCGVKGVRESGAYASYGADMAELRAWVEAKLLWNPTLNDQELIDEFLDGYYGPAAKHVRDYLNLIHDSIKATGEHLSVLPSPSHKTTFLSFEVIDKGWAHLTAAEAAVRGEPNLLFHVQVAQLPIMYTFMVRWDEMRERAEATGADWPMPNSIQDVYNHWMTIAKRKGIDRLCDGPPGFKALEDALERAK